MCKKVVLVMDNSEACGECRFYVPSLARSNWGRCYIVNQPIENKASKLSTCPLKELPEKKRK